MPALPEDARPYRRTATFDAATLPAGLRGRHTTREGTWARIVVLEGAVTYRILEPTPRDLVLTPARVGVVEPGVAHQLVGDGPFALFVEFCRRGD
ncbi:MAG: DUF1971 domain-containing protein [Myxococcales bacterium]|nr:DUF1971 domain-containing protein [Myxococcales bacterium]